MKKTFVLLFVVFVAAAFAFAAQPNAWACGKPGCPYGPDIPNHPTPTVIKDVVTSNSSATANPVVTANPTAKATAIANPTATAVVGDTKATATVGDVKATGGEAKIGDVKTGDITIGGTNITVPRNFGELPPAVQQQFSFAIGGLYIRSHLEKEEKKFLNDMLGAVPNPTSLSRETVAKNAVSQFDVGIKQVFNEIPVFQFFVRGTKGVFNYDAKMEFYEDQPPAGPAKSIMFVQKMEEVKFQIVERGDLEAAGWQIGCACVIQGVPGIWLSSLKWAGYKLLMSKTGYSYGAVTSVYRSSVREASGKNLQLGGAGNFLTGGVEQNAYNLLLGGGMGSGQNWESQKFDIVLVGLNKARPDAPLLIGEKPKPEATAKKVEETKPATQELPAGSPQVIEKYEAEKRELEGALKKEREAHDGTLRELAKEKMRPATEAPIACPITVEFPRFDRAKKVGKEPYPEEKKKFDEIGAWIKRIDAEKKGKGKFIVFGHCDIYELAPDTIDPALGMERSRRGKAYTLATLPDDVAKALAGRVQWVSVGHEHPLYPDAKKGVEADEPKHRANRHICIVWVPDEGSAHGHAHLHAATPVAK